MRALVKAGCFVAALVGCLVLGAAIFTAGMVEDVADKRKRETLH